MHSRDRRKILIFDIETLPDLEAALSNFAKLSNWYGNTLKATVSSALCIGYKWYGEKKTHCLKSWDYPSWEKSVNDDTAILKAFLEVVSEADAVVTHNGKKFDWPFLQTRLFKAKLPPMPHNIIHIDTKQVSKRYLYSISNRLNDVAELSQVEKKLENGGWQLWVDTWNRKPEALKLMERYCKQDVKSLEQVFTRLLPFVTTLPNANVFNLEKMSCPTCGSLSIAKDGTRATKTKVMQRFRCSDCGSMSQLALRDNMVK
jgi:DNA polymerase elongation subunit (family B)